MSPPCLVLSLDFELHWGVRDHKSVNGPYRANLLGARRAIPRLLDLFNELGISATWATVGLLFAKSAAEIEQYSPADKPAYADASLYPYLEKYGRDESEDPLHFAPSLIEAIRRTPRQEIGSHTFSHYYCLEPGQTADHFRADIQAAVRIANAREVALKSIVLPRNQYNPAYEQILLDAGITAYRGNQAGWIYRPVADRGNNRFVRAARLLDNYGDFVKNAGSSWDGLLNANGMCNIPASFFLRPFSPSLARLEKLRYARITGTLRAAAERGRLVHLWWHPHNFGVNQENNLSFLRNILEYFSLMREQHGMRSLTMSDAAALARKHVSHN